MEKALPPHQLIECLSRRLSSKVVVVLSQPELCQGQPTPAAAACPASGLSFNNNGSGQQLEADWSGIIVRETFAHCTHVLVALPTRPRDRHHQQPWPHQVHRRPANDSPRAHVIDHHSDSTGSIRKLRRTRKQLFSTLVGQRRRRPTTAPA